MDDPYRAVKARFAAAEEVTVHAGRGSQGLKSGKKMFAMFYYKGRLVVRLVPGRVAELIASGEGEPFDPGTGRAMADRLSVPMSLKETWIALCEESRRYAASEK